MEKTSSSKLVIKEFDAAIFDLDGVLTRTASVHAKAWKQLFDEYLEHRKQKGEVAFDPFDEEQDYLRYVDGKPRHEGIRSFLQSREITLPDGSPEDAQGRDTVSGLGNRKNEIFHQLLDKTGVEVYEDAVEMLHRWKGQGLKTAVVSSSKNCTAVLKAADLNRLFDARVDGVKAEKMKLKGKPNPDIFLRAAEEIGVPPSRAIVFEDAVSGVKAGRSGNFGLVVGVARQGEGELLRENGAHVVVRSLRELDQSREDAMDRMEPQSLPSALNHFDEIGNKVKNKRPAVFLDYDGTLTPIVNRPEDAVLPEEMRSLLRHLSSLCLVAVISGRDRADVEKLVGLDELIYAGSHGFDISGPGMNVNFEPAEGFLPVLDKAETELRPLIDSVPGASLERKRYAIAVHYRNVSGEDEVSLIKRTVDDLSRRLEGLKSSGGKKIIELRPDMDWDKGRAVLWLLNKLGADQPDVVPFYIGDDITDEDAFRTLTQRGIGILVGEHGEPTYAKFKLTDVDEMKRFLHLLTAILK